MVFVLRFSKVFVLQFLVVSNSFVVVVGSGFRGGSEGFHGVMVM